MEQSRQQRYYYRNKERLLQEKRAKYRAKNPQAHPWKTTQPIITPQKSDIDRMLDEMDRQRYKNDR